MLRFMYFLFDLFNFTVFNSSWRKDEGSNVCAKHIAKFSGQFDAKMPKTFTLGESTAPTMPF